MDDLRGQTIKGYQIRNVVGRGGQGTIYLAYQPLVEREVAIKVILPKFASEPDFIRSFEAEAQLVARLEHLHIVPLYDYWRDPSGAYLVMRWMKGGSLYESLRTSGPWPVENIARLLNQVAAALTVAHRNGVVHRDLKPANILLDEEQNAYLTDFGIAKDLLGKKTTIADSVIIGSPAYMAPEQALKEPITPQTDIYSLGVLLFELLTGRPPFDAPTQTTLLRKHVNEPLPPLQLIRPDLPYDFNLVIWRATAKDPESRYSDAMSFAADFHNMVPASEPARLISPVVVTPVPADPTTGATAILKPLDPENPYKGLRPFQEADAADFFGRQSLVQQLLRHINEMENGARFLAVVGPSGSGKSSVVKAGVIPSLRRGMLLGSDEWFVLQMTPGTNPFQELAVTLVRIALQVSPTFMDDLRHSERGLVEMVNQLLPPDGTQLFLLIDQFEEVFTLVEDDIERELFLKSLYTAATATDSRLRIVATLRADFYDRPLLYPGIGDLFRARTEVVLPLSPAELETAVVGPAERVGLLIERGLVSAIVADVSHQPGALPLMQYALTELYERRTDNTLTLEAYRAAGGVSGALARRADEIYQSLDSDSRQAARQLFLRLVSPGENADDTRRRVPRSELLSVGRNKRVMEQIIDNFGKYRLLAFDREPNTREPMVEVAHEALIREWNRLKRWLADSRDDLRIQRRLSAAAAEWANSNHDMSFLASGARLAEFEGLVNSGRVALNTEEHAYLQASIAGRQQAARRLRLFIAGLIIFSLVALGLALFAFDRQSQAQAAQLTAVAERDRADSQARISRSRELAVTALTNIDQLDLSLLLSLEALKAADTFEARSSLLTALETKPHLTSFVLNDGVGVRSIAYSPDGQFIVTGGVDGRVRIWNVANGELSRAPLEGHTAQVNSVAYSPDGRWIASGGEDSRVWLWGVETGEKIQLAGHSGSVWSVAFSPDSRVLASGSADKTIILWDVASAERSAEPLTGHADTVYAVAFSPDGGTLASGGGDNAVRLWDVVNAKALSDPMVVHSNWVLSVAFTPDGRLLASAGADNKVVLWNLASRHPLGQLTTGHQDWIRSVSFSPDGKLLATGSMDGTVQVRDAGTGQLIDKPFVGHHAAVWDVAFGSDSRTLASGSLDGSVILWDALDGQRLNRVFAEVNAAVSSMALSPDGRILALAEGDPSGASGDNTVSLWDVTDSREIARLEGHGGLVTGIAFSPNGQMVATASADQTLRLWDVKSGALTGAPLVGHLNIVTSVAFSPDGKYLASGSSDKTIILWDTATGQPVGQPLTGHTDWVTSVAFSPDGKTLATGSVDNTVRLWDVATGQPTGDPLVGHTNVVTRVAFSPDGGRLATGSRDNTVILWDFMSSTRQVLTGHSNWVLSLAFSPDGGLLATGSRDNMIILWDLSARRPLGEPLAGHTDWVSNLVFTPDGQTLISGGNDRRILLWDVNLESWKALARRIANRELRPEEQDQ